MFGKASFYRCMMATYGFFTSQNAYEKVQNFIHITNNLHNINMNEDLSW